MDICIVAFYMPIHKRHFDEVFIPWGEMLNARLYLKNPSTKAIACQKD